MNRTMKYYDESADVDEVVRKLRGVFDSAPEITKYHPGAHLVVGKQMHQAVEDSAALARIQDPARVQARAAFELAHQIVGVLRSTRTARGALVLAYIAPCLLRTPVAGRPCPEGWRVVELRNQGHTALNGTWWVCDEAFPTLQLRFASGGES